MIKQTVRMLVLGSVTAVVALAAMPAAAATYVSAYVFNQLSLPGQNAERIEDIQRLDAPASGPASVSATRATGTTFSITDYGLQRYYASADLDVLGNQQSTARGQFEDSIVINTGTPGESGVATFQLRLTGSLFASNAAANASTSFQWYNPAISSSFENWVAVAANGSGPTQIDQILTFQRNFVSGQSILLSANWSADAGVFNFGRPSDPGSGSAYADLSKTARWLGLKSAVSSGGQDVTSTAIITSTSGFDYSRPVVAPVPLPAAAWLMLSGLAGLGVLGRRRKAA